MITSCKKNQKQLFEVWSQLEVSPFFFDWRNLPWVPRSINLDSYHGKHSHGDMVNWILPIFVQWIRDKVTFRWFFSTSNRRRSYPQSSPGWTLMIASSGDTNQMTLRLFSIRTGEIVKRWPWSTRTSLPFLSLPFFSAHFLSKSPWKIKLRWVETI